MSPDIRVSSCCNALVDEIREFVWAFGANVGDITVYECHACRKPCQVQYEHYS